MIALFENCSVTSEEKKAPVKPLEFTCSCERAYQIILKDVTDKGYYGLKTKKEFYEIYYWYAGFEISISLVQSTQGSTIYTASSAKRKKPRATTGSTNAHRLPGVLASDNMER